MKITTLGLRPRETVSCLSFAFTNFSFFTDIKIFLGDDDEEEDDEHIEEMVTEANEHEGHHVMGNPRSSSVTGKYNDNAKHGNLFGAGALSSAASQAIQPSLDGFGGIVGVSAGTKSKQSNSVQN